MASNQPNRPWLRLTSLAARTNIPTPAPAPALRTQQPQAEAPPPPAPTTVVVARPTFRPPAPESHPSTEPQPPPTSAPKPVPGATSPPKPAPAPSPAIKTTSSSPPAATKKPSTTTTTTTAAANLSRSLKPAAESPPHSRNTPPSPLTLPPPQLKSQDAEQKTVLFQNTKSTSNSHLDHAVGKKERAHKKPSEETGVRSVITIAGENRGAFMDLIKSPRQKRLEGHHQLQKKSINGKSLNDNSAGSGEHLQNYSSSSSSEEAKRHNHRSVKQAASPMNAAPAAYMNSNVQGVNNSIVYNSSYTHHDPGVHLAFSKKPSGSTASGGKGN